MYLKILFSTLIVAGLMLTNIAFAADTATQTTQEKAKEEAKKAKADEKKKAEEEKKAAKEEKKKENETKKTTKEEKKTENVKAEEKKQDTKETKSDKKSTPAKAINLNTASKEELKQIKGIGDVLADEIIKGRPYKTWDDVSKVKGIGEGRLKTLKEEAKL